MFTLRTATGLSRLTGNSRMVGGRQLLPWNYFRVAKNNRSTLFDTVTVLESNSLVGYFRLNWRGHHDWPVKPITRAELQ
jgi:hypothetical protein